MITIYERICVTEKDILGRPGKKVACLLDPSLLDLFPCEKYTYGVESDYVLSNKECRKALQEIAAGELDDETTEEFAERSVRIAKNALV